MCPNVIVVVVVVVVVVFIFDMVVIAVVAIVATVAIVAADAIAVAIVKLSPEKKLITIFSSSESVKLVVDGATPIDRVNKTQITILPIAQ